MNISYEEFKDKLLEDARNIVRQELGADADVTIGTATEGEPEEVLRITKKNLEANGDAKGYVSEFRLKYGYQEYLRHPVWAELLRGLKKLLKIIATMPEEWDLGFLKSFETAKKYLGIAPLPMKDRGVAEDEICVMMDDIPMGVTIYLPESTNGKNVGRLSKKILGHWGVSEEEVRMAAMQNQMEAAKPKLTPMCEISLINLHITDPKDEFMFVATTEGYRDGAVAISYPGFLDDACEKIGEDVFIYPSSVHEVMLVKESHLGDRDLDEHDDFIRFVNRRHNDERDVLSDKLYHYERATKTFESARSWYKRVFGLDL